MRTTIARYQKPQHQLTTEIEQAPSFKTEIGIKHTSEAQWAAEEIWRKNILCYEEKDAHEKLPFHSHPYTYVYLVQLVDWKGGSFILRKYTGARDAGGIERTITVSIRSPNTEASRKGDRPCSPTEENHRGNNSYTEADTRFYEQLCQTAVILLT